MEKYIQEFLSQARKFASIAVVSGSDITKVVEQLGDNIDDVLNRFDFVFVENGLVGFHGSDALPVQSLKEHVGDERLKKLINYTLRYFSEIDLPVKRGNFIEFRQGMLNLSPIGRSCTQEERMQFVEFDSKYRVREQFVKDLKVFTEGWNLNICIGGQISVDVFPYGWDKTFCLQYLKDFETIHFFGDKTAPGGNDHEIFNDERTIGHTVKNPEDLKKQVEELLKSFTDEC
ncbi:unnamed protein product [Dracunculus medinensis]|uniref:Phosphomannomutase n=1 Tax=Dracunculus medinensis TaxID=318479 RepID=A0A0N4U899_DRAME|nr:unnamed protein product [Dracunculus medinensis]